ncbi:hypothetical protein [Enterococcus phoeniculicola]|jgi:hypothetical protein|uniref:Uncharacterized protein n=1 Tax=Enterococcus phoeniculicola ATCC BAA-412 TaxID=1158610 RepID=R3TIH4_9ENTE|nr:hypothetical protein [Enterococcus phoeniculicola]EOL41234.1 hypothetical protein UC3_03443 [Enterococcus phoeniculicola ATCC BAA-412]EOT78628.1 hypothetical protein I589_00133 [Enterococcus phoeniculicola ATCC BAA-412]
MLRFKGIYSLLHLTEYIAFWKIIRRRAFNGEQKLVLVVRKVLNWHDWENDLQSADDFSLLNGKAFLDLSEEETKVKLIYSIGEIGLEIEERFAEILLADLYWYRGLNDEEQNTMKLPISSSPVSFF